MHKECSLRPPMMCLITLIVLVHTKIKSESVSVLPHCRTELNKSSNMNLKELIASKLEERKTITEYHLTTKKTQASVLRSIPTLTVTILLDQVVLMGTDTIIDSLNPELRVQLEKIVGAAAKSEMFKTTEEKIIPPLFAPITQLSSKLLQSQLLLFLSLLGFSTGG